MGIGTLLVRTDASVRVGTGHVMRCLALAQSWQAAGGVAVFLLAERLPLLEARLADEGIDVRCLSADHAGGPEDAMETAEVAKHLATAWVVIDGYQFGAAYQRVLAASGLRTLFVDDNGHATHYEADYVLNQNIHAHPLLYVSREHHTRLLLGVRYILLRREFSVWRTWLRRVPPQARKLLVSLGGSDPDNVTLMVLRTVAELVRLDLEVIAIVGPANHHKAVLQAAIAQQDLPVELREGVTDMPELLAWADIAVLAGGSTCWEAAFMGLPAIVIILANNQRSASEKLAKEGVVVCVGESNQVNSTTLAVSIARLVHDQKARQAMSARGRALVDGLGGERIVAKLIALEG